MYSRCKGKIFFAKKLCFWANISLFFISAGYLFIKKGVSTQTKTLNLSINNENETKKGGYDEQEDNSQDPLQDIGDSTSIHARDGDVPVNKKMPATFSRHIGLNSSQ